MLGRKRAGGPARRMEENRSSSTSMAMRVSSRASGAPMQAWMPRPKEMWLPWSRPTSSPSGSVNCSGVPVGAADQHHDVLAPLHREAVHVAVLDDAAEVQLHR